jgi:hypothetical protein
VNEEIITITAPELQAVVMGAVQAAMASGGVTVAQLPRLYKFPEDIHTMLGGHVATPTIRGWKTSGYLRTTKIGAKSFVAPEAWQWFIDNHKELMAKEPRNRGSRLAGGSNGRQA